MEEAGPRGIANASTVPGPQAGCGTEPRNPGDPTQGDTAPRELVMHSGPGVGSDNIWGQPGWAPGSAGPGVAGLRAGGPPGETLSWPVGPLQGASAARLAPRSRSAPCGAHPRPAVTGRQSRRGTSAVRGSPSPTRGSPLPGLSATQPHPGIPTIRLP